MTYYAVIDTNILVSAMMSRHTDSATVQIVDKMIEGQIIPVYSDEIMDEYREVLHRKKFKFSSNLVEYILSAIKIYGMNVSPAPTGEVLPDMKDLPCHRKFKAFPSQTIYCYRQTDAEYHKRQRNAGRFNRIGLITHP